METGVRARSNEGVPLPRSSPESRAGGTLAFVTFSVLCLTLWAVYGRAIRSPFIFDDLPGIVDNPSIRKLWPLVGDSATGGPLNPPPLVSTARRPLPNLTLALNYRFGGLDPAGYHLFNLLLHVLAAAVLASLVTRTLQLGYFGGRWDGAAWPLSLAVTLVWALHPLNTEAVVYVTQRTELLGAFFYLTTLWASLRYFTAHSRATRAGWLAAATLACLAGSASKETIVSAPLAVLLYERTFLVRSLREAWRSWALYVSLASSWVVLFLLSFRGIGGLSDPRHHIPLLVWWMTQAEVVLLYARLVVWPWPLSIHYAPAYLRTLGAAWPWVSATAILAAGALALVWRRDAARFVAAAVVLTLAPTLVVPLPKMMAAERRMYLPLAGLVALAIVGGYRVRPRLTMVAAAAVLVGFGLLTVRRLAAYESAITIWRDAVNHQPDDPMAHYNLGVTLLEDAGRPDEAMTEFEHTLRLEPEHTGALDNLGMILMKRGQPEDAVAHFERALAIEPGDAVAHNDLGAALITLGRPADAIPHLEQALRFRPDEPKSKVHLNLGRALLDTGRTDEAVTHLEEAIRLDAGDPDARYSLGVALTNVGRPADAMPHLEEALRLKPRDAEAWNAFGTALLRTGQRERSGDYYERALELRPDYPEAQNNLGAVLLALGQLDEAMGLFEQALRSKPDNASAHYNLARALLSSGRPREAVEHFREAVRLDPGDAQTRFDCAIAYARAGAPAEAVGMAEEALATARARGETDLVGEIANWLASSRAAGSK